MKQYLSKCVMISFLLYVVSVAYAHDFESDGIYYNITDSVACEVEVTYSNTAQAASYSGDIIIPATVIYDGVTYSVSSIASMAMYGCYELTSISFTEGLRYIGTSALADCTALTSLSLPNSLETMGESAFASCVSLESVVIGTGLSAISGSAFRGCIALKSVVIPDNVTAIERYAFMSTALKDIVTESVTYVGSYAFAYCDSLVNITMNNVNEIAGYAFYKSGRVKNVELSGAGNCIVGGYSFMECSSMESLRLAGVDSIGTYAFSDCTALSNVSFGDDIRAIGKWVFYNDTMLTELTFPESLVLLQGSAFRNCKGLTSVTIPGNGSTQLIGNCFAGCSSLTTVTLGDGVASLINGAFYGADSIKDVFVLSYTPPVKDLASFSYSVLGEAILHVPEGTAAVYSTTNYWNRFANIVDDIDDTTPIESPKTEANSTPIYVGDGMIIVQDASDIVEVYTSSGTLVYRGNGGTIKLQSGGIYVIRTAERAMKIIV